MSNQPSQAVTVTADINQPLNVVMIEHRHGTEAFVCTSPEVAQRRLFDWVDENWHDERERGANLPAEIPADPTEAVATYFEAMCGEESYVIAESWLHA